MGRYSMCIHSDSSHYMDSIQYYDCNQNMGRYSMSIHSDSSHNMHRYSICIY